MTTGFIARHFMAAALISALIAPSAYASNANDSTRIPGHAATATTQSSVQIGGQRIGYTAVTGTIALHNTEGAPTARIFYVAYFKKGVENPGDRPITFFYNGGPGSSSIWLHMAAFGPRRVVLPNHAHALPAPYRLVNNQYSLLNATDLVFIDAPSTGFSRIVTSKEGGAGTTKDFYGVDEDAGAFAKFVTDFLSKYHRWNSPKYLFGESYGTTRTVVLSRLLQRKYDVDLNGIMLLSAILNFSTSTDEAPFTPGIDLPYELALPTYAAAAWYHHKLNPEYKHLSNLLPKVEKFALGPYAEALLAGSTLSTSKRQKIAQRLHEYTGLPVSYLLRADLRVKAVQFEKELLAQSDLTIGRLDSRYKGPSMDPLSESIQYDPTGASISSPIVSLFNHYVRTTLDYKTAEHYRATYPVGRHWNWQHQPEGFGKHTRVIPNVMTDLSREMKHNPELHVMLNGGYYDLATPFYAAVFIMHHLPIPQRLQKNISYHFYRSGHMVYLHVPSLKKLHHNVTLFISATSSQAK